MKRAGLILLALTLLAAIPMSNVFAGDKCDNGKVELCHFDQGGPGHVIEVNENAVKAHLKNHGDCFRFYEKYGDCKCIRKKSYD